MKKLVYSFGIGLALMFGPGLSQQAEAQEVKTVKAKKPMNKKTKYTLIGAGAGIATGVITSKNDSKGAIIGGVAGAGAGYLYGRHRAKKKP
jgi:hypothetical protein